MTPDRQCDHLTNPDRWINVHEKYRQCLRCGAPEPPKPPDRPDETLAPLLEMTADRMAFADRIARKGGDYDDMVSALDSALNELDAQRRLSAEKDATIQEYMRVGKALAAQIAEKDAKLTEMSFALLKSMAQTAEMNDALNSISHHSDCRCRECAPAKPATEAL